MQLQSLQFQLQKKLSFVVGALCFNRCVLFYVNCLFVRSLVFFFRKCLKQDCKLSCQKRCFLILNRKIIALQPHSHVVRSPFVCANYYFFFFLLLKVFSLFFLCTNDAIKSESRTQSNRQKSIRLKDFILKYHYVAHWYNFPSK